MYPFAEWRPDLADLDSQFARDVKNVVPLANSYGPMASLSALSGGAALVADAKGVTQARQSGGWGVFAGTATKLYKYNAGAWDDVTRLAGGNYTITDGEFWRFAQFGDDLIACNINDAPQSIDVNGGTNFAALAGSPPQARNVSVVGDFVVLSSLSSNAQTIHWSAINDPTGWTVGTDLSDTQMFPDGGRVVGVAGGEVGYVLQEYAIRRMRFQPGSDYVFTFEKVVDGKGCVSPYGYATIAGTVFFISEDGPYAYAGDGIRPIASQRVSEWFQANCDVDRLTSVQCVADPYRTRIYWFFYASASSTSFDRILLWDWSLERFTYGEVSAQTWGAAASPGTGLDSITTAMDSLTISLDSRIWEGGRPTLCAIDTNRKLAFLEGDALAATLETSEVHPAPGQVATVTECYPLVDASSLTVSVGTRARLQDTAVYSATASLETTGKVSLRSHGRLHRYRVSIPASATWTHAQGVVVEPKASGLR